MGCKDGSGQSSTVGPVAKQIMAGMPLKEVESVLNKAGMEYTYYPRERAIYAIERNTGGGFLVKDSQQLIVEFDVEGNVAAVKEKTVRTGP